MNYRNTTGYSAFAQYSILLLVVGILLGFVNIIPSLLNATYHTQELLSEMRIAFYTYKDVIDDTGTSSSEIESEKQQLLSALDDLKRNRFYNQMAGNDRQIRTSLRELTTAVERYISTGSTDAEDRLEQVLSSFSSYMSEYTRNQKFTLTVSLVAALFTLLIMVVLIFYLYRRNRTIVAELRSALNDREYLLKEIHHRIKNNLTMISSLINIKSRALQDDTPMRDLSQQVDTIGMVHELLYHGEDIASVDLGQYLNKLLNNVFYSLSPYPVEIEVNADNIDMDPKKLVPVGLIVTEIATNAVKHGFTEEERVFRVTAEKDNETDSCIVTAANTGHPFPEDRSPNNGGSMGMELINALVQQLQGNIELQRYPMTTFTLRFPQ